MANFKIRKNSYGENLSVNILDKNGVSIDLTGIVASDFTFQKPDETIVHKTGSITYSGSSYYAVYLIEQGFLDQVGQWKYDVTIAAPGVNFPTDINSITVLGNLE
jgi:hypothetical protein